MGEQRRLYSSPLLEIDLYRCRQAASGPGPEEWSPRPEIALPLDGVFVKHAEGRVVTCDAATAATFNPGETYRVSHPGDRGDLCLVLAPAPAELLELLSRAHPERDERPGRPFREPALPIRGEAALELRLLRGALASPAGAEAIEELAAALLASLTGPAPRGRGAAPVRGATRDAQRALVEAARRYLREHLAEPASLGEVARGVGCTPFHLARVFRRETGWTLRGFAMRLRLGAALDRLAETRADLSQIAAELGFADHGHLTRRFRGAFGTTPSAFRRRLAELGRAARRDLEPGALH